MNIFLTQIYLEETQAKVQKLLDEAKNVKDKLEQDNK